MLTVTALTGTLVSQDVDSDVSCAVGAILGHLEVENEAAISDSTKEKPLLPRVRQRAPPRQDASPVTPTSVSGEQLPVPAKAAGMGYFSPRLRARMTEHGLRSSDITGVRGTGRAGRVSVNDLENSR